MKKYKIKVNKELIKRLKPYWKKLKELNNQYRNAVGKLEIRMSAQIGISDLEFFMLDNEYQGIGNLSRTMRLIHGYEELEEK